MTRDSNLVITFSIETALIFIMFRNAKRFQKLRKSAESAVNMSNFRNSSRSGRKINELIR